MAKELMNLGLIDLSSVRVIDLVKDSKGVIDNVEKYSSVYGYYGNDYSYYDDDDDYYNSDAYIEDCRRYWQSLGIGMTDEEWDEYQNDIKAYEKSLRKGKGTLNSQKFINGIEVDDDEFNRINNKGKKGTSSSVTRRGGKKHKQKVKKRSTTYVGDEWDALHNASEYEDYYRTSIFANERKVIKFHRNLPDEEDVYVWNNLHEFNEWIQENNIEVSDNAASSLLHNIESHCCLDIETTSKRLIVERSYGDLVWEVTGGDEDMIKDPTNHWNYHRL